MISDYTLVISTLIAEKIVKNTEKYILYLNKDYLF